MCVYVCASYLAKKQYPDSKGLYVWDKYHTEALIHISGSNMIRCGSFYTPSMNTDKMPVNTLNFYNHLTLLCYNGYMNSITNWLHSLLNLLGQLPHLYVSLKVQFMAVCWYDFIAVLMQMVWLNVIHNTIFFSYFSTK